MADIIDGKPSTNFWIVGGAALVWNLLGLMVYVMEVTAAPEALAAYTEAQQAFLTGKPAWATGAFALAVTAGVLGSLFLLLRKTWAVPMFVLSLAGLVVQNLHAFLLADGLAVWGTAGLILPAVTIIIAVALLVYSRSASRQGWLT